MFELHAVMTYVYLFLASAVIGFGWSAGCWLFGWLARDRRRASA